MARTPQGFGEARLEERHRAARGVWGGRSSCHLPASGTWLDIDWEGALGSFWSAGNLHILCWLVSVRVPTNGETRGAAHLGRVPCTYSAVHMLHFKIFFLSLSQKVRAET